MRVLTGVGYPYPPNVWTPKDPIRFFPQKSLSDRVARRFFPGAFPHSGRGYDLIHAYNCVPLAPVVPFGITFESYLPRVFPTDGRPRLEDFLWNRLRSPLCAFINAKSLYAVRQFEVQNQHRPGYIEIRQKIKVVYPAFPTNQIPKDRTNGVFKLLFAGHDFIRKGGGIVCRAHEILRKRGIRVETTVVSHLGWNTRDYVGPSDKTFTEGEIARLKQDGLTHIYSLGLEELKRTMREADIFLAPTIHDTFGYAQCQAMACGTPAIITRTCAQLEIMGLEDNLMLDLPNDTLVGKWTGLERRWSPEYTDIIRNTSEDLAAQLADRVADMIHSKSGYKELSARMLDRARTMFGAERHADILEAQYASAIDAHMASR